MDCQTGSFSVHEMARDEARHGKALKGLKEAASAASFFFIQKSLYNTRPFCYN